MDNQQRRASNSPILKSDVGRAGWMQLRCWDGDSQPQSWLASPRRCGELCAAETRSLLGSLRFSQSGAPAALCSARCQVRCAADGSQAAKNRGRSHAEMEERAKAEPVGINVLGEGNKCDAGLARGEDSFS